MTVPHPIPYQGSKRKIADQIIACLPTGTGRLVELFAGSAAVSLAAAASGRLARFWLNDLNAPLMALWDGIINTPEQLAAQYRVLWLAQRGREKEYFFLIRDRFNQTQRPDYLLYLLARCVKAAVRYNAEGAFNQSPDNRRKGTHPDTMEARLRQASRLLSGRTTLTASDYREMLGGLTQHDLVYLDPPYQGVGGRDPRYLESLPYDAFVESLEYLNSQRIAYLVSYDGRTGDRSFGKPLPASLGLTRIEIEAGRSSQATLLGRNRITYESLYLSPALMAKLEATTSRMFCVSTQKNRSRAHARDAPCPSSIYPPTFPTAQQRPDRFVKRSVQIPPAPQLPAEFQHHEAMHDCQQPAQRGQRRLLAGDLRDDPLERQRQPDHVGRVGLPGRMGIGHRQHVGMGIGVGKGPESLRHAQQPLCRVVGRGVQRRVDGLEQQRHRARVHRPQQIVLAAHMPIQRGSLDAQFAGDPAQR